MSFGERFSKGSFDQGLFECTSDIPGCLKDCCCFACITSQAINSKIDPQPCATPIAYLGAFCGCSICLMAVYGNKMVGAAEPIWMGVLKAWLCGPCYAHQLSKEKFSKTKAAAAGVAANVVGAVSGQMEMS